MLKASEVRLEEEAKQSEAEVQATAAKLFELIDSISKHKRVYGFEDLGGENSC
ncbi:unnamed protein product [Brassica napus]|uniref:(rape) hypothetical protein n=1 Tax=Brassica napus TaxID=3708 RepID=A0A816YR03_BRANA|nr:unnamed protein product [Brassica napus]